MGRNVSERRLVDVLVQHYRQVSPVGREVPHYEKRIDLLMLCQETGLLEGVEAKTKDWTRALQQALLNLTAVEFSYIAVWSTLVHRVDHERLSVLGIGLISVGTKWGEVERVLPAKRSPYTNRFVRESLASVLGGEKQ